MTTDETLAHLKGQLDLLIPMIQGLAEGQRRTDATMAEYQRRTDAAFLEVHKEFGLLRAEIARIDGTLIGALEQIGHRISDLSARLPVTLGYTPPDRKAS